MTKTAEQKARQLMRKIKRENPGAVLVVTGCYAQTDPESVKALPGVDLVTGVAGRENLPELVAEHLASGVLWPGASRGKGGDRFTGRFHRENQGLSEDRRRLRFLLQLL